MHFVIYFSSPHIGETLMQLLVAIGLALPTWVVGLSQT